MFHNELVTFAERQVINMKAKKLISVILAGVVAASMFAGCGSNTSKSQSNNTESSSQSESDSSSASETVDPTETPEKTETPESTETQIPAETEDSSETASTDDTESAGKTLVVYYSATGSTKAVANYIADATGGDLFELEPVEPYTDEDLDWTNDDSRVSREHDDESLRDVELVSTTVDNFGEYTELVLCYPIWWSVSAWPVNQFVKSNDFTGKTIIPVCTSASSGIGGSGKLLEEMAGTGDWQEGKRFSSNASEEEVQDWVKSLNLN